MYINASERIKHIKRTYFFWNKIIHQ